MSRYDAGSCTVEGQGVRVKLADGVVADEAALARGEFVTLELRRWGTSVVASTVRQRSGSGATDLGKTVEVKGVTRGIDWNAASVSVTLCNTAIQASAAVIAACPGVTLAVGAVVKVMATVQTGTDVVLATSLSCTRATTYTMRSLGGTAGTVDSTARTFVLTTASASARKVQWSDQTVFAGVTATSLDAVSVLTATLMHPAPWWCAGSAIHR